MTYEIEIGWKLFAAALFAVALITSIFLKKYESHKAEADAFRKIAEMKGKDPNVVVGKVGQS